MIQPKQLLCAHIYCLQCLQEHFNAKQELSILRVSEKGKHSCTHV